MTTERSKQSPTGFLWTVIGLTTLAVIATALIGFFVTSAPRGFIVWVMIGFLCAVELLVGIITVNTLAKTRSQYRPNGATIAITYGIVGLFAVTGFISIVIYWAIRGSDGTKDGSFIAILLGIMIFWFIIAALIYTFDLHTQAVSQPVKEKRVEHRENARSIKPILTEILSLKTEDENQRKRLSLVTKKLETIDTALAHSHGGGIGSREAGHAHHTSQEQDKVITDGIMVLGRILPRLSQGTQAEKDAALAEFEQNVTRMSVAVASIDLY